MRKNKKASIISLEVLIGVVISIIIIVSAVTIISNFFRLSDASKDSFNQLVVLIEEVNRNDHGTRKSMPLRMDKGTAIIGFPKNNDDFKASGLRESIGSGAPLKGTYFFPKPIDRGCEKDKACICLCRELDSEYKEGEIKCKDEYLLCRTFEELEFSNPFLLSRSLDFYESKKDAKASEFSQFRVIYVEKYGEYSENLVAVCGESEEDSCISKEYREEKKAIHSLNNFKNFIELCKDREFVEDEEPCSCGAFNFRSFISEGYSVEFSKFINSESDEESLKLTLMKGKEEKGSIKVDTKFCVYPNPLIGEGKNSIYYPKDPINLEYNIEYEYTFCYGNCFEENYQITEEDYQIAFIKYDKENICLAYHTQLKRGYIEPYAEPFDTIIIESNAKLFDPYSIVGCKYPSTETNKFW